MRRTGVLLVAIALGVAGLTGCSGGDDKYCSVLKSDDGISGSELSMDDPKAMEKVKAQFKKVTDAAPGDVKDDWKTMSDAMDLLATDPSKVDPEQSKKMDAAWKAIAKDTKDRCGLDLNAAG